MVATGDDDALGEFSVDVQRDPPPPTTARGAPCVVTFASAAAGDEPLQLCCLGCGGELLNVGKLLPGERPHVESTRLGCTFVLLPVGDPSNGAGAVAWYRPTRQLQGARHAVVLEQLPSRGRETARGAGNWRLTVQASREWQSEQPNPEYRVVTRPNSCVGSNGIRPRGAPLPPPDKDWILKYRYDTPSYPTRGWIPTEHTFFIWGDVDFDQFNAERMWSTVAPGYRFNQIVPQLMTGWCLADSDEGFNPRHVIYDHWVIQAQYYWQRVAAAGKPSRAACGPVVRVEPGDMITTEIEYTASNGAIQARIFVGDDAAAAVAANQMSWLDLPRPFPEPDRLDPAYDSWRDFFAAGAAAAGTPGAWCNPAVQIETKWLQQEVLQSICPWKVSLAQLQPGTDWSVADWCEPFVIGRAASLTEDLQNPAWAREAMVLIGQRCADDHRGSTAARL